MDLLKLTYSPDDDGTGELSAFVQAEGFAGSGSAWFGVEEVEAFCSSLGNYPLDEGSPPHIQAGYRSGHGTLNLAIGVTRYGGAGALKVTVQLAEFLADDEPADRLRGVSTWFVVGYNDLKRFQTAFENLLKGRATEAVLTPGPT